MLRSLRLANFAVVESIEVSFGPGLTVLTGETGAGKSILIDALGLLMGGRAESTLIRAGASELVVEAVLERTIEIAQRLEMLGLPDDGVEVSLRRTLGRGGRGRVHVNGALATVGVLQRLMRGLVDIAGQHDHLALFDPAEHLGLVDAFGQLRSESGLFRRFQEAWAQLGTLDSQLRDLGGDEAEVLRRRDFLAFQLEEIERLAPTEGEDEALEQERRRLASQEKLLASAHSAMELLSANEGGASELLGRALKLVLEAQKLDPSIEVVRTLLFGAQAELEEAARGLGKYAAMLESNPARLEEVEERLDALRRLCRKHAAPLAGVLAKQAELAAELKALDGRSQRHAVVEAQRREALAAAEAAAEALSCARRASAQSLESSIREGLGKLALKRASFEICFEKAPLSATGADRVEWLFCANPGEPPRSLAKVASGGEASRLMLALKGALANLDACHCSVLDEADAGLGGAVADVVGRLIKDISAHRQVLCVTHLPQVAAYADAHFLIEKVSSAGRTRSTLAELPSIDARSRELARMLSGAVVTQEAFGAARALLRDAGHRHQRRGRGPKRRVPPLPGHTFVAAANSTA